MLTTVFLLLLSIFYFRLPLLTMKFSVACILAASMALIDSSLGDDYRNEIVVRRRLQRSSRGDDPSCSDSGHTTVTVVSSVFHEKILYGIE